MHLEEIALRHNSVFFSQQITDGAIKNLAFCCRMLNVLNLAGCKLVCKMCLENYYTPK